MKRTIGTYWILIACCLVAGAAFAGQDGVLLRRDLKEGETEIYKATIQVRQRMTLPGGMGEQEATVDGKMTYVLNFGKVDEAKDNAAIDVKIQDISMDMGGAAAMAQGILGEMPREMTATGRLDRRNRLEDVKFDAKARSAMMAAGASPESAIGFIEFPVGPVKIGEEWDVILPKSAMYGNREQKLRAKLVGERTLGERAVWVVEMKGEFPFQADPNAMGDPTGMGLKFEVSGRIDMKSEALVEKTTGRTLSLETQMSTTTRTDIADMNMSVDSVGDTRIKMVLQERQQ
jgi:hypothetical protein